MIELWIGTQCPTANPEGKPGTPKACVQQLLDECLKPEEGAGPVIRCRYRAELKPVVNAYGLLTLEFPSEQYQGGAHGVAATAYLNIDTETGDPLRLQNLIRMKPAKLQALLESRPRETRGIPPGQPLTEAGLLVDTVPVPEAVLVDAEGLRFLWQASEIAPYAEGAPSLLIPYSELAPAIPRESPLRRLPAAR